MGRTFSDSDRWVYYKLAGGKCEACRKELHGVFEVDHRVPYSKGGRTEPENAQVLCVDCNRRKGDMYHNLDPFPYNPRFWQRRAHESWLSGGENVLIVATPGAGKTIFALRIAHQEILDGKAQQILIVVPTDNLRDQWVNVATSVGLNFATDYDAEFELAGDFHGIVTTYQTIASRHDNLRKTLRLYTSRKNTLAILDEIHHVGVSLTWADSLVEVCNHCYRRLLVTGTPFRSDRFRIPYVNYIENEDGSLTCKPDYEYGYGPALRDGVVRPVYFQTFDGEVSWFSPDGELVDATFQDELPSDLEAHRIRFAVDHRGDFLRDVFIDGDKKLNQIRHEDYRAGGVCIAKDTTHAAAIAKLLENITGEKPFIATSNTDYNYPYEDSNRVIEEFRCGTHKWIIAVKMLSEGVDIKRLRVSIWATNITTELFFRQVVGRIVRMDSEGVEDQYAYQYIPKLAPITDYAETLKQERIHVTDDLDSILDEIEEIREEELAARDQEKQMHPLFNQAIGYKDDVIVDERYVAQQDLQEVYSYAAKANVPINDHIAIKFSAILQLVKQDNQVRVAPQTERPVGKRPQRTLEQRKQELRKQGGLISRAVAALVEESNGRIDYPDIHRHLNYAQDVQRVSECTLDQLEQRVKILMAWKEHVRSGATEYFSPKRYIREHLS